MCIGILTACVSVYHMCLVAQEVAGEDVGSPEMRVTGAC